MKFDTIIIGGGLTGLTTGIKLAEEGEKCAIISSGQCALHFFGGSFDLLGNVNGHEVSNPLESMKFLPPGHPYTRIGSKNIIRLVDEIPYILRRAGIDVFGDANLNHYVLTPMGTMKPAWLTLNDFNGFEENFVFPWQKAIIFNFNGFLDFHTLFVKDGLKKIGVQTEIINIGMKQMEVIRRNPSEMRSTNIAKVFDEGGALNEFVTKVNELSSGADSVILPSVFGLFNRNISDSLKAKINKPVVLIPIIPPSVPGIRSQILLRKRFQQLGGTYFLGDHVEKGVFQNDRLQEIYTVNHGNIKLVADRFVLASGSFYSKGLAATPYKIYEPIFGLDTEGSDERSEWTDENFFNSQPFMTYGVKTNENFCALKEAKPIDNLYVAGSVLGGTNALKEGSGAGISLLSSLFVAEQILKSRK